MQHVQACKLAEEGWHLSAEPAAEEQTDCRAVACCSSSNPATPWTHIIQIWALPDGTWAGRKILKVPCSDLVT